MNEPVTIALVCIKERKKQLRSHLQYNTGMLLISFSEIADDSFGKFEVRCTNAMQCYSLGISVGRLYILSKTNISADDKNGGY